MYMTKKQVSLSVSEDSLPKVGNTEEVHTPQV